MFSVIYLMIRYNPKNSFGQGMVGRDWQEVPSMASCGRASGCDEPYQPSEFYCQIQHRSLRLQCFPLVIDFVFCCSVLLHHIKQNLQAIPVTVHVPLNFAVRCFFFVCGVPLSWYLSNYSCIDYSQLILFTFCCYVIFYFHFALRCIRIWG